MNRTWRYLTVTDQFWTDRKIRDLSVDGRFLAIYLLTNSARTTEGFYSLRRSTMLDDLGLSSTRLDAALIEVADCGFAAYDEDARVVLLAKGLKYNAPTGSKSITGAVRRLDTVRDSPDLFARFLVAAERYARPFADAIRAHYELSRDGASDDPSM